MGKRWRIPVLTLLMVLVIDALALALLRSNEPVYGGRPVSYWINHPAKMFTNLPGLSGGPGVQWTYGRDLSSPVAGFDSRAVPFLVKALERRDGKLRRTYVRAWTQLPAWVQIHLTQPVPDSVIRVMAMESLGSLGKDSLPAVPALIQVLKSTNSSAQRFAAVVTLAQIDQTDPEIRKALLDATLDTDAAVRMQANNLLNPGYDKVNPQVLMR